MLQKLKFKLVLINVVSLTAVLLSAFLFVYISLETRLKSNESVILNKVADEENIAVPDITIDNEDVAKADNIDSGAINESDKPDDEAEELTELTEEENTEEKIEYETAELHEESEEEVEAGYAVYSTLSIFYVKKDLYDNIVYISPNIFEKQDHIRHLIWKTDLVEKDEGAIDIGEIKLSFLIKEKPNGKIYVYIDRQNRVETMESFIFLAAISWAVSIICVFGVSLLFADKAIKPVRESMERQDKFIADASHELRTPIAVIRTNTELIMDSPEQTVEENMKWLKYILNEAKRVTKMTEELLILSRSSTKKSMTKEKIDLSALAEETFDSFRQLLKEHKLDGEADITSGIWLLANGDSIKQMITILIDNAIKYTNTGSIRLVLEKDTKNTYIKVIDTGTGIEQENIGKIFERFFRADKSRTKNTGGAGLGLSIAWVIAKEHNGQITVKSEIGKGSEFCVILPL